MHVDPETYIVTADGEELRCEPHVGAAARAAIFLVLRIRPSMNFLVWQLIDSGFPSGGFAHSGGLEASVQHGHVADSDDVRDFARQSLAQAGRSALPLVTAAHGAARRTLRSSIDCADVFLSNPVANRASRAQGRALLTSVVAIVSARAAGGDRGARPRASSSPRTTRRMFGAVLNALDVSLADTQRAFLFMALRGVTSAAVRLGLIGGYEAQDDAGDRLQPTSRP